MCFFVIALTLCLFGCEGALQIEDFRPYGFRAQAVIHRGEDEAQVLLSVSSPKNGTRSVAVEWLAPEDLCGLRICVEGEHCLAMWYGMEVECGPLRSAVGDWDDFLSEGEWGVPARTEYRGREAILVELPGEGERCLYMDREGKIPLGMRIDDVEWEFLSYERVE